MTADPLHLAVGSSTGSSDAGFAACEALFGEMLPLLYSIRDMADTAISDGSEEASQWTAVRTMAGMAGALADRGGRICGTGGSVGGFDDWMASPTLRKALQGLTSQQARQPQTSTSGEAA